METFHTAIGRDFGAIADLVAIHAEQSPHRPALRDAGTTLTYAELDALMDRIAASLQRDGLGAGDAIAICTASSVPYAAVFLGALRAGIAVAPLAPGSTPASLARMMEDAEARLLFIDASTAGSVGNATTPTRITLDGSNAGRTFDDWL